MNTRPRTRRYRPADLVAVAGLLAALGRPAWAGPENPQVVHGNASFAKNGALTTITASDNAIINYRAFDIRAGEVVKFVQPSSKSRVLNRIESPVPTRIDGSLSANGIVYLLNPSGVLFGNGAKIDAAGITAAAAHLSDRDFLSGVDHFTNVSGPVTNAGSINVSRSAVLIGNYVANSGTIAAKDAVVMAVGEDVLVSEHPLSGTFVRVAAKPEAEPAGPGAASSAKAKRPSLGAGDLYSLAISQSGTVQSKNVKLESARRGTVRVAGKIDATDAAGTGGRVEITGSNLKLAGASIDASGATGGGTVLIGGGKQGTGDLRHAETTIADASTSIRASATDDGPGGSVILWSDGLTSSRASIAATGGPRGGDGGFAEISSKQSLDFTIGATDLRAARGKSGTLLLDPTFVLVTDGIAGSGDQDAALVTGSGTINAGDPDTAFNTVSWGQIAALAGSTTNIVIQATNTITFGNITGATPGVTAVDGTATIARSTGQKLRFEAQTGNISFSDASDRISITGAGSLELVAGGSVTAARLDASTGTISITAGTGVSLSSVNAQTAIISAGNAVPGSSVSQSASLVATGLSLLGSADFQLTNQDNNVASLAGSLTGASSQVNFRDDTGFSIGTVAGTVGLNVGTAATNRFLLQTNSLVSQTQPVIAGQFRVLGNGAVLFTGAGNDLGTISGILTGPASAFSLRDDNGVVIGTAGGIPGLGIGTLPANILFIQSNGPVSQTSALVCGGLRFTGAGDFQFGTLNNECLTLAANLTGPASTLVLRDDNGFAIGTIGGTSGVNVGTNLANILSIQSGGGITQTQPITAGQVRLLGTGIFSLLSTNNDTTVLAGSLVGVNSVLEFRDDNGFSIGSVLGTNGVSIALDPTNRLSFQTNGVITQTQPISAGAMRMLGAGSYDLSAPTNAFGVVAASLTSPTSFITVKNTADVTVGTVAGTVGVNIGSAPGNQLRLITDGAMIQTAPIVAGVLELTGAGSATLINPANDVTTFSAQLTGPTSVLAYADANNFNIGTGPTLSGITLPNNPANILLIGSAGTTTQTSPIACGPFVMVGGGSLILDTQNNSATTIAIGMTGANSSVSYRQDSGIAIGSVVGINGASTFTAPVNTITFRTDGALSQSQPIVTNGLRILGTGLANLTNTSNSIATLAANLTGPTSALAYTQIPALSIGSVSSTNGINIGTGAGNLLLLTSDGALTQTQPIAAGSLTLSGAGSATLTSAANTFPALTFASLGGGASITSNPAGGQLSVAAGSVGTGATIISLGDLRIAGQLTTGASADLRAGTDGTGNLSFAAGSGLRADTITLRAGDGPGGSASASLDAGTNAPSFANAAGSGNPTTFSLRADAPITSSQIPAANRFGAGNTSALPYTILSDQGAVTISDGTRLTDSVLTANGTSLNIADNLTIRSLSTTSPVAISGNTELTSTQATLSFVAPLTTGAGNATLTADEIDFASNVSGTGTLTIRPLTASVGVGLAGTDAPSRLDLTAAELARIQPGLSALTIGNSTGTGPMLVSAVANFRNPVTLRGPGGITLNADVRSQGTRLTFANPVRLGADIQAASTDSAPAGADVEFLDTVDAQSAGGQSLTIFAGTSGVARLGGPAFDKPVGGLTPVKSVSVTASSIATGAATSFGFQDYFGAADVRGNLTSQFSSLRLAGSLTTTGSRVFSAATTYAHQSGLTASGPLTISAGSDATFTGPTAVTGNLAAFVTGNLTATGLTSSTGSMNLNSGAAISTAGLSSGSSLSLTSVGNTAASANASATGAVNVNSGGTASFAGLSAGTSLNLLATGAASFSGPVSAGTFVDIDAAAITAQSTLGAATTASLTSDANVSVAQALTAGATVTVAAPTGASFASINSGTLTVNAGPTTVSGPIVATGPIQFTVGSLTAAAITGQSSLGVTSTGLIAIGGTTSLVGTANLAAGSTLALASFSAGPGLTITSGAATFNGAVSTTGTLTANIASLNALSTINAATLAATSTGSTSVAGQITTTGNATLSSTAATLGPVNAGGALALTATGPVSFSGPVSAGSTLNISGAGIAAASSMTAGSTTSLNSSAALSVGGTLNSGGLTTLSSTLGTTLAAVISSGNLSITAAGIAASSTINATGSASLNSTAAISVGNTLTATGPVTVTAGQTITLANVSSGPNFSATGTNISAGAITTTGSATIGATGTLTLTGLLNASGPATLTSTQGMSLANVTSGASFTATSANFSAGAITSGPATVNAGGTLTLTGSLTAGGAVTLASTDDASVRAISAATSIAINSGDNLALLGALTAGTKIAATAAGDLSIAGSAEAATSIGFRSGLDGTGNLTFTAPGLTFDTDALTLRAGDGPGGVKTATVNALTNAPTFRSFSGAGTSPSSYTHQQDGSIVDAQTAAASQFAGGLGPVLYRLISDDGSITIADASKFANTDLTVRSATGFSAVPFSPAHLTIEGPLASGNHTIDVGAGTLVLSDAQGLGTSDLTIFADEIEILAPITGTGRLTLGPGTLARPVVLNNPTDSSAGALDLTASELDRIADGFAAFTIGRADSSGPLSLASARTFRDPTTLRVGPTGQITLDQPIIATGDASFRAESTLPIRFGTTITTQGRDVTFAGPVSLIADATVNTSGGGVTFQNAINASADNVGSLTLQTASGTSTLLGPVGQAARPAFVQIPGVVTASSIRAVDSITLGALTLNANARFEANNLNFSSILAPANAFSLRVTPTGASPTVNFTGDVGAPGSDPASILVDAGGQTQIFRTLRAAGPITFSNAVAYNTGVRIIAADAPITFATDLTGKGSLTIDAGSGATSFQSVTTTLPDGPSLTLLSGGLSTFNAPVSLATGLFAAGPVRIAANVNIASPLAPTTLNNSVDLVGTAITTAGDITFGFSAVHLLNPVAASSVTSSGGTIRIKALTDGTAALTFAAPAGSILADEPIGSVTAPASLNFAAPAIALKSARTTGAQTYSGAATLGGNLTTSSGAITLSGPITLATDVTIDSTALATSAGAPVAIAGTVDSDASSPRGLSVVSGASTSTLSAGVGQTQPLSGLTVAASSYQLPAVRTTGPQTHVGTKTLNGDLSVVGAGEVTLGDATTLGADISITTPGAATDTVRIAGTLDDSTLGAHQLSINSGAAQTLIDATVGSVVAPRNLSVVAGSAAFRSLTQTDSFRATGPVVLFDNLTILNGDMTFDAPVIVANSIALGARNITFNSTLRGDSGPVTHDLVLNSPGLTSFNDDVGYIRPFETITTDAAGSTRIAGPHVITMGAQTYADPVTIGANTHIAGSTLSFLSSIDSDATPRSLNLDTVSGGSVLLAGPIGATSPLGSLRIGAAVFANPDRFTAAGNPIEDTGQIRLGGNVSTTGDITFGGPLLLNADAVVRSAAGNILFRSTINSDATPRTLAVLSNRDTSATQPSVPLIRFNGGIGQSSPLANLWINYLPASFNNGVAIDGRAQVPVVSTVVLADQLDPDGNIPASSDVTHALNVTTTGDIIFGLREKLLSIGTANLTASGKIALGDITTLADANINGASGIELRRREVGNVLDIVGVSVPDLGLDYVSAGKFNFSRTPAATDSGPDPTFANPTGERGTNSEGFAFRLFTGGIDMARFSTANSAFASALDLRSLGPSDTNVAQAIAGAIPTSDTGSVTTSVTVGAGLRDQLAEIGIFVKDLLPEDVLQMLAGRALYNDVPSSGQRSLTAGGNPFADPTLGEYRVSVNRLPTRSVIDVLNAYQALAYKISKDASGKTVREDLRPAIRDQLLEAWRAFAQAESGGKRIRLDARRFRVYLESRGSERTDAEFAALATLEQIKEILARLRAMGLSPVEYQISRNAILSGIAPEQIGTAALGDAAEFDASKAPVSKAAPAEVPEPTANAGL